MIWGDLLGMCIVILAVAVTAWGSRRSGWAEGHGDGWRGAMEQNTNVNSGLRAELAAAHEATDEVRKKLKGTEQRLAVVGEEWNRALEERDRYRGEIKRAREQRDARWTWDMHANAVHEVCCTVASDVEKVLFTRGRGITHEWRRKKLLALCADVRKRWSKAA